MKDRSLHGGGHVQVLCWLVASGALQSVSSTSFHPPVTIMCNHWSMIHMTGSVSDCSQTVSSLSDSLTTPLANKDYYNLMLDHLCKCLAHLAANNGMITDKVPDLLSSFLLGLAVIWSPQASDSIAVADGRFDERSLPEKRTMKKKRLHMSLTELTQQQLGLPSKLDAPDRVLASAGYL